MDKCELLKKIIYEHLSNALDPNRVGTTFHEKSNTHQVFLVLGGEHITISIKRDVIIHSPCPICENANITDFQFCENCLKENTAWKIDKLIERIWRLQDQCR